MNATPSSITEDARQQALLTIYQRSIRQRFKAEINRLTRQGMLELLGDRVDAADLSFLMTYVYAWHWLRHHVAQPYRAAVLAAFKNPDRLFLMQLLLHAESEQAFIKGYIDHWRLSPAGGPVQQTQLLRLLQARSNDPQALTDYVVTVWRSLHLFEKTQKVEFAGLARHERDRYGDMLSEADLQRLALVDELPDVNVPQRPRFDKLGIIPAMGCPQTCRHCMFIWRPLKPTDADPQGIYRMVDSLTDNVLFTGGDLTRHLDAFYDGIRAMRHVTTFAILLNGDFADDSATTHAVLGRMAAAIQGRPAHWPRARILLQISFDEFHQEVYVDKHERLQERIPVAKIANIVESAPRYAEQIQLALLHKQTGLNFSLDVLQKGVFARLVQELAGRGHQLQVLSTAPSARLKRHPITGEMGKVLKDANFVLKKYPQIPIMLTSSTIDGYGRAALLEPAETIRERELLQQVLTQGEAAGERFDIDLMLWFNGWATLFNAVHICLGDVYQDGLATILARQRKDPLTQALHRFDRRLLDFHAEIRPDLPTLLDNATGPHHLFHMLTEDSAVRLHMTQRLLAAADNAG